MIKKFKGRVSRAKTVVHKIRRLFMSTENRDDKNTPSKAKHTALYYLTAIVCACILTTAILLVVFLPNQQKTMVESPPVVDRPVATPTTKFALPIADGVVTSKFGFWYNDTLRKYTQHNGIDFKAAAGTNVKAVAAGTVEVADRDIPTGGRVIIDHGNGLKTVYMSIDVADNIKTGSKVEQGTVIGTVSSDTDCMGDEKNLGAHLHFEVLEKNDTTGKYAAVDPALHLVLSEK